MKTCMHAPNSMSIKSEEFVLFSLQNLVLQGYFLVPRQKKLMYKASFDNMEKKYSKNLQCHLKKKIGRKDLLLVLA